MNKSTKKREWWKKNFENAYLSVQTHTLSDSKTKKEVDFIIRINKPSHNDAILDLACGFGRHSIELSKRGYKVTGGDFSLTNLNIAKRKSRIKNLLVNFIKMDMRKLQYKNKFDLILLLFTSFGYFPDTDNMTTIKNVSNALKADGKFLLDVYNGDKLISDIKYKGALIKKNLYRLDWKTKSHKFVFVDRFLYNEKSQRVVHKRNWYSKNEKGNYQYDILHYTIKQYMNFLPKFNLYPVRVFGDYNGSDWSPVSERTIIQAAKTTAGENIFKRIHIILRYNLLKFLIATKQ